MTLAPGSTLGRYQILEPLGQGGMAVVYKAYQPALDRTVALKVIRKGFAEDPEFRDRFAREARAIARLDHPNIVDVFDFDEVDGQVFLAMQYLEGGTLKDRLVRRAADDRRMDQDEVARIVARVADALRYAHDEGVIHRDVKPSNVMLTKRGDVVVTDFGIAKIVGGTQHTATGVGIGTPEYMSPEQGQGQSLDGRTDQYALAVMAYEMLAGQLPYSADTPFAVVLKHVRDPLPLPSKVDPAISARTEKVLLRALAKDPKDRYPTVSDFADELERAVAERPGRTLPTVATPRRAAAAPTERVVPSASSLLTRPIALAAAGVALLLLGGGSAAVLGAFNTASPTPSATLNVAVSTTPPPTAAPPTPPPTTPPPTPPPTPTITASPSPSPTPTAAPATTAPVAIVTTPPPTPPPTAVATWAISTNLSGKGSIRADYDRPFRALGSNWMSPTLSTIDSKLGRTSASIPTGAVVEAWITGEWAQRVAIVWPGSYSCTNDARERTPLAGGSPFVLSGATIICMFSAPPGPGPHTIGLRFEAANVVFLREGSDTWVRFFLLSRLEDLGRDTGIDFGRGGFQQWLSISLAQSGASAAIPIGVPLVLTTEWGLTGSGGAGFKRGAVTVSWTGGAVTCSSPGSLSDRTGTLQGTSLYVTEYELTCTLPPATAATTHTLRVRLDPAPSATPTPLR